ncbi:MAG TPA: pyridoxal 5'-phosphate synthase, partial [Candidatus Polarisedimenticolaceae bacterium]|nr:pyridoxal 5'-phosphate synthase [Candidatus Polarisedimenticolaceae bacterium]
MLPVRQDDPVESQERETLDPDPWRQFAIWLEAAVTAGLPEPMAMTLATADAAGRPSARIVLLKGTEAGGLVFATNYGSRKAVELDANPHAALLFHWEPLGRQLRIEGTVERADAARSDAIHRARPRGSQL